MSTLTAEINQFQDEVREGYVPEKKTAPDYGEPWRQHLAIRGTVVDRNGTYIIDTLRKMKRAVACVNACAGMTDPSAEIQAMRDAIRDAHEALTQDALWAFNDEPPSELSAKWTNKSGSLTHGPNNCRALFNARKAAIAKLQPFIKP